MPGSSSGPLTLQEGRRLWKFNAGSGSRGGPISYAVNGKQYIAIPTGLGSHAPSKGANFVPAEAYKVIVEGRRGTDIMPPWGNAFTPEEIWELVAYLNHLSTLPAP